MEKRALSTKNKIYFIFCAFHIFIIILISFKSTINSYCTFYHYPKPKGIFMTFINYLYNNSLAKEYAFYTAAETGYGYFAPNVLSSGVLQFKSRNKQYQLSFPNYETKHRFSDLCSRFIYHSLQSNLKMDTMSLNGKYEQYGTYGKMDSLYHDLILKSICVNILNTKKNIDTLQVTLEIYDYPQLKDYRKNPNITAHLIPLYEKYYFFKN